MRGAVSEMSLTAMYTFSVLGITPQAPEKCRAGESDSIVD